MNRLRFGIAQFVGISLAEGLIPSHPLKMVTFGLLVTGVTLVFGLMGFIAAKRLEDIGWPRKWAMLVAGPATLNVLLGLRTEHLTPMGRFEMLVLCFLCVATIAYAAMTIVLVLKAGGRRVAQV